MDDSTIDVLKYINKKSCAKSLYGDGKEFFSFFFSLSSYIIKLVQLEDTLSDNYFTGHTYEELLKQNNEIFTEISKENYVSSFTNPDYAVSLLGEEFGPLLSAFYSLYINYTDYAYKHNTYKMKELNRLFIEVYELFDSGKPHYECVKNKICAGINENLNRDIETALYEEMDADNRYYNNIIETCDVSDLRYMFRYGKCITENEIETARSILRCPEEIISKLADTMAKAYLHGFISQNKNRKFRTVVKLLCVIGHERIMKQLIEKLKAYGLQPFVYSVLSTDINKQFDYDHRFDNSLFLSREYIEGKVEAFKKAVENCKSAISNISGVCGIIKFGELPFTPVNKKSCLKLSGAQGAMLKSYDMQSAAILAEYMPGSEISFCKAGLPSYEIGNNFDELMEAFLRINMTESAEYEAIQQTIIDALDKGEYIHVKGRDGNLTDIKVRMNKLANPEKETNYLNGGADINIPYGEVFTTPVLNGTTGVLHFKETYLKGFKYVDLKLRFEDGYIREFSCANFPDKEENIKYIMENLLFPYDSLPMGEFAVGTNTTAYVLAKRYNIMNRLPVLIAEKTGPHFAIGDPCYSRSEESPIYNLLDNKEIVAKENEKTAKRKSDIKEAYTGIHMDITIPYEDIAFISVLKEGEPAVDIIRDGMFALAGTEKLNEAFSE